MSLQVCILLPDGIFYNENVAEIIRTTTTGQLGILKGHAPLITIIEIGPIIFRRASGWTAVALLGGIAFILNDRATIIVNSAEMACSIERDEVEKSFEAARNRLNKAVDAHEKVHAANAFRCERARYETVRWQNLIHYNT
jgi:ATP synthase F1 epsilon subunit